MEGTDNDLNEVVTTGYDDNATIIHEDLNSKGAALFDTTVLYQATLGIVYACVGLGLPLNILAITAYAKTGLLSKGKPAHQFLFNLMISDIISLLSCQPFLMFNYVNAGISFIQGKTSLCITSIIGMVLVWDSSRVGVFLLTAERLYAIAFPLSHMHRMTRKIARWTIVMSWVLIFIKGAVVYFWNDYKPYIPCRGTIVFTTNYLKYVNNPLVYGSIALITFFNFILLWKALRALRRIPNLQKLCQEGSHGKQRYKESEIRMVKFIFVLVAILFLTWAPFHIICYLLAAVRPRRPPKELVIAYHLTRALTLISTVVDPIIYFREDPKCKATIKSWMATRSEDFTFFKNNRSKERSQGTPHSANGTSTSDK